MKKTIFIVFAVILARMLAAQNDRAAFGLKGDVIRVKAPQEESYELLGNNDLEFSKTGKLLKVDDVEITVESYDDGTFYSIDFNDGGGMSFTRDKQGRIKGFFYYEGDGNDTLLYDSRGRLFRIISYVYYEAGYNYETGKDEPGRTEVGCDKKYFYDENDNLIKVVVYYPEEKKTHTITYTYKEFDGAGNWTKRVANCPTMEIDNRVETRTLSYLRVTEDARVVNSGNNNSVSTSYGLPCPNYPTVTDVDGNTYNTVQIGRQCWMRENLRTTKKANGKPIPKGGSYNSLDKPYYYDYTSSAIPLADRGYLYNWVAALEACPAGWHLPSDAEWTQLENYIKANRVYVCGDNERNIAKALACSSGWKSSTQECAVGNNQNANNTSGFCAVPAGSFGKDLSFSGAGSLVCFWASTAVGSEYANTRLLREHFAHVVRGAMGVSRSYGYSVRCVKD